ncbi:hypothetical protein Sjap_009167 [Stephania japonica]|uniref:Aminoacyl-tRNA synthetase class II (D/K/N) domain-containing protein n=1 Tax=Stephania japonica TaxID=461633 RepID=A0AAP0JSF0_9MAGN
MGTSTLEEVFKGEEKPAAALVPQSKYSKRVVLKSVLGRSDGGVGLVGERVVVGGWVNSHIEVKKEEASAVPVVARMARTESDKVTCVEILQTRVPLFRSILKVFTPHHEKERREAVVPQPVKAVPSTAYLQVNDGSSLSNLQVVLHSSTAPIGQFTQVGTSILVEGIIERSEQRNQVIELKVEKILHLGFVNHDRYPLAKKRIPIEDLRTIPHLRPRTKTVQSIARIRGALSRATHTFFQNHDFIEVHMPVVTNVDAKVFSEKLQETTEKVDQQPTSMDDDNGPVNLRVVREAIKEKADRINELSRSDSNKEALVLALQDLKKTIGLASELEENEKQGSKVTYNTEQEMHLTASYQLHLESYACALGNVYTFGPTFRAEKSLPSKHLAESWTVELEMAFADLEDVSNCAEDYIKFLCQSVLENCPEVIKFIAKRVDNTLRDCLESVATSSFQRITYTEALEHLEKAMEKAPEGKTEWGLALTEEQERHVIYLSTNQVYKKPVIIYNHPKDVKPFFVHLNDDGKTVAAFDVIIPGVGKLVRGSQKEERVDKLNQRMEELGLSKEQYEWYLDLRRHGTVKHSGFSLEFDHLVLLATAQRDVRDVVAFPRS